MEMSEEKRKDVEKQMREAVKDLKDAVKKLNDLRQEFITNENLTVGAVAFAVGLALGALLGAKYKEKERVG